MGNSTMSLRSGYNYNNDNSLIAENISTFYDKEEDKRNMIYIRNRFKKLQNEENKNDSMNNNHKIPTMFEWSFKGNSVYLTGSFCNWQEFFLMKKDEHGIYRLILDLKRGFHQYKFKIDNEWKYNQNFPTYNDNGFINNYIDTSNWEINGEYENEEINNSIFSASDIDLINYMKEKNINLKLSKEFYKAMIYYGNYIPLNNELENTGPIFYYQVIMDCINKDIKNNDNDNEKDKKILIREKIRNKQKNIIYYKNENNMFIYNNKLKHEQINHLHLKKIKYNNPLRNAVISRFRLKYTTFVYYK